MAKKRKASRNAKGGASKANSPESFKNSPFKGLGVVAVEPPPAKPSQPQASPPPVEPEAVLSDEELFARAMDGTAKIPDRSRPPVKKPPEIFSEDEEAQAELEFVRFAKGEVPFDISDTDEYLEGRVRGLPPQVLKRLKRGEYAIQGQLDLHGLTREEARDDIDRFLTNSRAVGLRCVLIIHGRGLHSKDQIPVLKESLRSWFERGRGRIGRNVLAFTSARPVDGGLGAMYVLLRRRVSPG